MGRIDEVIEDNFKRYAGNVILDRAICDARDMLKPSARMLLYCQRHITKSTPDKGFVKSALIVGDALGHYYSHGDTSCYDTYMRMAKPFAMRYPLEVCQGNSGTIVSTNDHAAMRYTELKPSALNQYLFNDIDKNTIERWNLSFNEQDKYPSILCSKGFYNIVNGTTGIGVSLSSSIPQFNIRDINEAMIKLLYDENAEINVMPDFATGGILLNASEVRESLKRGWGAACKIRARISYDKKENAFKVSEFPYGVYGDTITEQIKKLVENDPNCGIKTINDGSGKTPDYMILLEDKADPEEVLYKLYKETALQSHYTINMTVLVDEGRRPEVLGLKELLLSHIAHEKIVYRRGFEYDLTQLNHRKHILDGYIIILEDIENVVKLIKSAESAAIAKSLLIKTYGLDDEQASAVLKLTLSRLAHLEIEKIKNELSEIIAEIERIESILNNEVLFNKEIERGLKEVADKFGDARRTEILDIEGENDDPENIITLQVSITNQNRIYVQDYSSLYAKSTKPQKPKLNTDENITHTIIMNNNQKLFVINSAGNYNTINIKSFSYNKFHNLKCEENTTIVAATPTNLGAQAITLITKNGLIKQSLFTEYKLNNGRWMKAISLDADDTVVSAVFNQFSDNIGILTSAGYYLLTNLNDITLTGRVSKGVKVSKLGKDEYIVSACIANNCDKMVFIDSSGNIKITATTTQPQSRTSHGTRHVMNNAIGMTPATHNQYIVSTNKTIYIVDAESIPLTGNNTKGINIFTKKSSEIVNSVSAKI